MALPTSAARRPGLRLGMAAALLATLDPHGHPPAVPTADMVRAGFRDADPRSAWRAAHRLLRHRLQVFGGGGRETAEALVLVAKACRKRGNDEDPGCVVWAERGLAVWEHAVGRDHPDLVDPLRTLATVKLTAGQDEEVEGIIHRLLGIYERHHGRPSREVAMALGFLGNHALARNGDPARARRHFAEALAMLEHLLGPRTIEVARARLELANAYAGLGDYDTALPLARQAVDEMEKGRDPGHRDLAAALESRAAMLAEAGAYPAARRALDDSESIRRRLFGDRSMEVGACLARRGVLLVEMGDDGRARQAFEEGLAVLDAATNPLVRGGPAVWVPHRLHRCRALLGLAGIEARAGRLPRARTYHARARQLLQSSQASNLTELARAYSLGAALDRGEGRLAAARDGLRRALGLREETLGPQHPLVAETLNELSRVHSALGESRDAGALLERSLELCGRALGEGHRLTAETLALAAAQRHADGDAAGALEASLASERLRRDQVAQAIRHLSERAALRHVASREGALDEALALAAEGALPAVRVREVWDSLALSRGLVLGEMAARQRRVLRVSDQRLARLQEELAAARRRLAHLAFRPVERTSSSHAALVREAAERKERLEVQIGEAGAGRRADRPLESLADAFHALPAEAALVAFAEYRPGAPPGSSARWLAFVKRPGDGPPRVVPLGASADLRTRVGAWRNAAAHDGGGAWSDGAGAENAYREAATALREALWDPLLPALAGARRVFVLPDGILHHVNLATLPAEGGGYLVEHGPLIHHLVAERDLLRPSETHAPERLLALGGPDFGAPGLPAPPPATPARWRSGGPACGAWRRQLFEPLPQAALEVSEIAREWRLRRGAAVELTGGAASEDAFKRLAAEATVLHLASHAFFVEEACRREGSSDAAEGVLEDAPLLLSGLALAGANVRDRQGAEDGEDGMLTAEEVASLDLSRARWVVLSACETGAGDLLRGEGVVGLRRAFAAAGAGTVIMSLWRVEDQAARRWMRSLYAHRLGGLGTAEAVRAASLDSLRESRRSGRPTHPRSWGAFVAVGDWR